MNYGFLFASNLLVNTQATFVTEVDGKAKEFFRVREIWRARSPTSYLALDVDIKDVQEQREIKLAKSNPVAQGDALTIEHSKTRTGVFRADGSLVINVEQLDPDNESIPARVREYAKQFKLEAILRVTGDFQAGTVKVHADTEQLVLDETFFVSNNLSYGTGGIVLMNYGFEM